MQARMKNPAMIIPETMQPLRDLNAATEKGGVPATILGLTHMRASQINGCSVCVDMGWRMLKKAGEKDERIFSVAAWRDAPYFSDAERAALALAETMTRLNDRSDPVPDVVWDEAARHHDEKGMAALILSIGTTNVFNRLNVTTRQLAGEWIKSAEAGGWS